MGYESGLSTATVSGALPITEAKTPMTLISRVASGTLGTVPASKIWRIVYMHISGYNTVTAGSSLCSIQLNGVRAIGLDLNSDGTVKVRDSATAVIPASIAPILTAGQTATAEGATGVILWNIGYIEESV